MQARAAHERIGIGAAAGQERLRADGAVHPTSSSRCSCIALSRTRAFTTMSNTLRLTPGGRFAPRTGFQKSTP